MNRFMKFLSLGVLSYSFLPAVTLAKQNSFTLIGNIQDTREIQGGGCSFQRPKQNGYIFWSTDSRSALMNIDGKDRILKLVSETRLIDRGRKGDRATIIYKTGKITVRIDRVTTKVCRAGDMECESVSYEGKFKISAGDRQQTLTAQGDCSS
jgi:hypothetical protein